MRGRLSYMNINFYTDSIFTFVCTILVMLMTPALALFYGGMVKRENALSTAMHSYASIGIIAVQWILIGYSLAFGTNHGGFIGSFDWAGLKDVGFTPNENYSATIPHSLFMMFQMMFAILTPAILSGSIAERMRFGPFLLFILVWTTLVYDPIAHWVWGVGGWLRELGALDFAGGTVIHIASGVSGLVVALVLGKRINHTQTTAHNIKLTLFGAGLLWFGWFGFNVGSALSLNKVAMNAFITTMVATATAALVWMVCDLVLNKKIKSSGNANGIIAGLVGITPACGFVTPMAAILIGAISAVICYFSVTKLKEILGYDDTLDAFGLHGAGGIWGAIATGLFATVKVNEAGKNGLFYRGGFELVLKQLIAVGATALFCAAATFIIIKVINKICPIRVNEKHEEEGLDISLHGEKAYS